MDLSDIEPVSTTGLLHDGDGTYRCNRCGETFNGRYLNHYCAVVVEPRHRQTRTGAQSMSDEKRSFALTEPEVDEINAGLTYLDQHYRINTDPPMAIEGLDWASGANRWAAFTTDELWTLAGGDWGNDDTGNALHAGIDAELARRKDTE